MKYYRCDCCNKIIEDPYDVCAECYTNIRNQLREFAPRCGTCAFYSAGGMCCINRRGHKPYNSPCAGYEKIAIGAWKNIDSEEDTNE